MQGKRIQKDTDAGLPNPGEYYFRNGIWFGMTPNGHLANLSAHTVEEHLDGTITVSPSIAVSDGKTQLWHGFIEKGVWREC